MHIRQYQSQDLEQTVTLWWNTRHATFPYISEMYTFEEYISHFRDVVAANHAIWVAEIENRIVAFIAIKESYIGHLYVNPSYQHQGIGTALLNLAKQLSPDHLSLVAFEKNTRARTFYEKHGFKAVKFGISPDEREPDVHYEWKSPIY